MDGIDAPEIDLTEETTRFPGLKTNRPATQTNPKPPPPIVKSPATQLAEAGKLPASPTHTIKR